MVFLSIDIEKIITPFSLKVKDYSNQLPHLNVFKKIWTNHGNYVQYFTIVLVSNTGPAAYSNEKN